MANPRRIVSLISSGTEILYLLGLGDQVVGVSHECDFPTSVAGKPRLTRSLVEAAACSRAIDDQVRALSSNASALYSIDVERLAELAPDLIITQAQCDVCAVRYEDVVSAVNDSPSLQHTEVLALNPLSLSDVYADILRIGSAAGAQAAARQALDQLEARVETVRHATSDLPQSARPRVACLEWIDPPMLAANWTPELVEIAGGRCKLTVAGVHSSYANWEQIIEYDPQVVVIMPCGFDRSRAIVESQVLPGLPGWSQLSAVRHRRVYAADGNAYFNRSGPRLVDSLEILAHLFHPERCAAPWPEPQMAWRRLDTYEETLVAEGT